MNYTSIGVDYSIAGPSLTVSHVEDNQLVFVDTVTIYKQKKHRFLEYESKSGTLFNLNIYPYPFWKRPMDRYMSIYEIFKDSNLISANYDNYNIEGYSYGSVSSSKDKIIENTQTFKLMSYLDYNILFDEVSPKSLKSNFAGNGNSDKVNMGEAFNDKFGFYIHDLIGRKGAKGSPQDNIVDSIALSLYGSKAENLKVAEKTTKSRKRTPKPKLIDKITE